MKKERRLSEACRTATNRKATPRTKDGIRDEREGSIGAMFETLAVLQAQGCYFPIDAAEVRCS
jgi:hypothetical protein